MAKKAVKKVVKKTAKKTTKKAPAKKIGPGGTTHPVKKKSD